MIVVSACLAGEKCRFDGRDKACNEVIKLVKEGKAIAVCPEVLAGLGIPREPCEMKDGRIVSKDGRDLTDEFMAGAKEALEIADKARCTEAILKTKSPTCGSGLVPDGSFSGRLVDGDGIFTKLLKNRGFKVMTEKDMIN